MSSDKCLTEQQGIFTSVAHLEESSPILGSIVVLAIAGIFSVYSVDSSDSGSGILLDNGRYANKLVVGTSGATVWKGGIDVSTGDAALPVSPDTGWQYTITVGGAITVTKDGSTPTEQPVHPNDNILFDGTDWWLFDSDGVSLQPIDDTVSTPYTLDDQDSGKFLVFDNAGDVTLNLPDTVTKGLSVAATNIGGGNILIVNTGTDTTRGALTLGDVTGYLAVTKITDTIYQSSERA